MIVGVLDTNIIIDILNNYAPALAWAQANADTDYAIIPTVWFEVIAGAQNKKR